jgi:hypothetical protein
MCARVVCNACARARPCMAVGERAGERRHSVRQCRGGLKAGKQAQAPCHHRSWRYAWAHRPLRAPCLEGWRDTVCASVFLLCHSLLSRFSPPPPPLLALRSHLSSPAQVPCSPSLGRGRRSPAGPVRPAFLRGGSPPLDGGSAHLYCCTRGADGACRRRALPRVAVPGPGRRRCQRARRRARRRAGRPSGRAAVPSGGRGVGGRLRLGGGQRGARAAAD